MNQRELAALRRLPDRINNLPLSGPNLDEAFYIFAISVRNEESKGKRKLTANRIYYLLDGFVISEDKIFVAKERYQKTVFDYYVSEGGKSAPHVTVSAILGENGAGKSSLVEFELRLINNLSSLVFGEYAKVNGWPHLHYIDDVDGELFYLLNQSVYRLSIKDRDVKLYRYPWQEEKGGMIEFRLTNPPIELVKGGATPSKDKPIKSVYYDSYYESIKKLLKNFFYTVVLNQSVYAYNTNDFWEECNSEDYEKKVRQGRKKNENGEEIPYSIEDRCWLSGLFHKNDGYQIPVVLMPYRFEGNYDINTENRLAYERLMSIMVRSDEDQRLINGHLRVISFILKKKNHDYDLNYIHQNVGYGQFTEEDFDGMKDILLKTWGKVLQFDILKSSRSYVYRKMATDYLVYKTLKIASTYDEYRDFRYDYLTKRSPFNAQAFESLVERTIANYSHVTNKLYRTIAYLIWDIFEIHGEQKDEPLYVRLHEINEKWIEAFRERQLDYTNSIASSLIIEASVPPPFFDATIGLVELNTGVFVHFEYLSSGEKQQAYTTSSLIYHLKNLDSVSQDRSTSERVAYEHVQLVLEEVELYFHPELQREFVCNLLEGIKQAELKHIKWISICIVTHSPFVLSDIPAENVLALKKDGDETSKIPCFASNIHDMLKLSFFLKNGTIGDLASWTTTRIAKCLKVYRWMNDMEPNPEFFPSLKDLPKEYVFLEEYKTLTNGFQFSEEGFKYVYTPMVLLSQINLIGEPVIRRVLLDDYKRTFPEKIEDYKESMKALLLEQIKALDE